MRIVYVLLSPTFGMHQYTADLANRMAEAGHSVALVTTTALVRDRYSPAVEIVTPANATGTGFSLQGLNVAELRRAGQTIKGLAPDVVHFTGVHLWNVLLVWWLVRVGIPVVHTLHDLDPHIGVSFSRFIRLWNRWIVNSADHLLVHGQIYADRLLKAGIASDRVTCVPLLHLFLSYSGFANLGEPDVDYERWGLFFGRLEHYKGVAQLIAAVGQVGQTQGGVNLILAGQGDLDLSVPPTVELRNRRIGDQEAIDLFSRCGVLVMPYLDATQSALIGAAYYFKKPVIVTNIGALGEYVQEGVTGWVVPAGDVSALSQALSDALSDSGRLRKMGGAGRSWYNDRRARELRKLDDMYQRMSVPVGIP